MTPDAVTTPLLSIEELAAYLQVPVATVRTWRVRGGGPPGYRVGKHVRYRREDVDTWLEQRADAQARHRRSRRDAIASTADSGEPPA